MKEKIKYEEIIKKEIEIDVDYPFYRKHIFIDRNDLLVVYYFKIMAKNRTCQIKKKTYLNIDHEIETSTYNIEYFDGNALKYSTNLDLILGKNEYKCTEDEFNKILDELMSKFNIHIVL